MTDLLLKAGRVFDGLADRPLEQAYVAIQGGHITAVGSQSELQGAEGRFARVVDLGAEATLLPGLINMHTHMSFSTGPSILDDHQNESHETRIVRSVENLKRALAVGVTTMRDLGTRNEIALPIRDAVERGTLVGPRVMAAGAGITTTGGHCWFCCREADGELEVRRAVRAQAKAGADLIKVFATGGNSTPGTNPLAAQYSEAELRAATEEARRLGLRVASHAHGSPGVRNSIAARVTTVEHCTFQVPDGIAYDAEQARIMAGEGIYVCPTIFHGIGKFTDLEDAALRARQEGYVRMLEWRYDLVNRLVDAGVKIVSGNDAGVSYCAHDDYPGDLILSVQGTGLSPAFVLRSATSVAAEALGREDLGVLAKGRAADLLAVGGDVLGDITALRDVRLVVARGALVERSVGLATG